MPNNNTPNAPKGNSTPNGNTNPATPPSTPVSQAGALVNKSEQQSFQDTLYENVTSVLGGQNSQELFCLTLPGLALAKETYEYDLSKPKPASVEYEESLLANKMFDVTKMAGSDNARLLTQQYRSALEVLVPTINIRLAQAKGRLRKVLLSPMKSQVNGVALEETLQQAFFKLYDEWVEERKVWANMQIAKKQELEAKYPESLSQHGQKRKNDYLEWYEIVADTYLQMIDKKYSAVLGLFSPNDMHVIQGILSSGSGEELYEARTQLVNAKKTTPDGGSAYPVTLQPANWFKYLDNSFSPVDMLESKEAVSLALKQKVHERNTVLAAIDQIEATIPTSGETKEAKEAYQAAKTQYETANNAIDSAYTSGMSSLLDSAVIVSEKMKQSDMDKKAGSMDGLAARVPSGDEFPKKVKEVLGAAINSTSAAVKAQEDLLSASLNVTQLESAMLKNKSLASLGKMLGTLRQQLNEINEEVGDLKTQLGLACSVENAGPPAGATPGNEAVLPNRVPKGFTSLLLSTKVSNKEQSSSSTSTTNTQKKTGGFWFFSAGTSTTTSSTQNASASSSFESSVSIGMSVAKVSFVRNWFNPGVFSLTKSMFNASSSKISNGILEGENYDYLNEAIFPCFPTSFVVARDVSIKFDVKQSESASFATATEKHVASGGGLFCFKGSSGSSTSDSETNVSVSTKGNSVVVRFGDPQILGYFLQFVPKDESKEISYGTDTAPNEQNDISFFNFIQKFHEVIIASQNTTPHAQVENVV